MKSKRFLSIILVFVMVFAMATTACGKKEEAAEKEEPKQEEVSDADAVDASEEDDDAEAADEEEAAADEVMKTGDDTLTEEDIQGVKDSIRDAVISEYLEANNISVEDFAWPDKDSGEWGYMVDLNMAYDFAFACGEEMDISDVDSSQYSNPEIIEAAFNGIISWLDKQGKYDDGYIKTFFQQCIHMMKQFLQLILHQNSFTAFLFVEDSRWQHLLFSRTSIFFNFQE